MYNMKTNMDLSKVVKIGIISGISIIGIIAITNMLFPSNAINLHEQACMSLANQMIENMEESNFDTEKFGKINSNIFVIETTYKLNKNKSLKLELQHLSTKDDNKNWSAFGLEYNLSSAISLYVSDLYNYQNPKQDKKIHYYNVGGSYSKGINRYTVNYGRQRGGLVCTGGICRYVPESTGLSFSITTSFF